MTKPEFNNGFITAIALFLEHKNFTSHMIKKDTICVDLRLYGAADHLFELEIPDILSVKLKNRIKKWRTSIFNKRLDNFKEFDTVNALFKEGEDILAEIDKEIFKTKKVVMMYR